MPKIRWTLDQKKHHVAAWRASGLTREQYCELYDIPFKSLRQWPQDVAKAEQCAKAPEVIPFSVSTASGSTVLTLTYTKIVYLWRRIRSSHWFTV